MFEYFGLKDVFANIKRFWCVFTVILVVFLAVGAVQFFDKNEVPDENIWTAVAYYSIGLDETPDEADLAGFEAKLKRVTASYGSLMNSDVCFSYICNRFLENSTAEDIIKQYDLNIAPSDFDAEYFLNNAKCNVLDQTNILNIFVMTENEEFSSCALDYYCEYLTSNLTEMLPSCRLELIKRSTVLNYNVKDGAITPTVSSTASSGGKMKAILIVLVGVVLDLLWVFAYTLFHPTLNRKSDFEPYGVKIIAEIGRA